MKPTRIPASLETANVATASSEPPMATTASAFLAARRRTSASLEKAWAARAFTAEARPGGSSRGRRRRRTRDRPRCRSCHPRRAGRQRSRCIVGRERNGYEDVGRGRCPDHGHGLCRILRVPVSSTQIELGTVMVISDDGRLVESQRRTTRASRGSFLGAGRTFPRESRLAMILGATARCRSRSSGGPLQGGRLFRSGQGRRPSHHLTLRGTRHEGVECRRGVGCGDRQGPGAIARRSRPRAGLGRSSVGQPMGTPISYRAVLQNSVPPGQRTSARACQVVWSLVPTITQCIDFSTHESNQVIKKTIIFKRKEKKKKKKLPPPPKKHDELLPMELCWLPSDRVSQALLPVCLLGPAARSSGRPPPRPRPPRARAAARRARAGRAPASSGKPVLLRRGRIADTVVPQHHGPVPADHHEPHGLGEPRPGPARVLEGAASDDQPHGARPYGPSRMRRERRIGTPSRWVARYSRRSRISASAWPTSTNVDSPRSITCSSAARRSAAGVAAGATVGVVISQAMIRTRRTACAAASASRPTGLRLFAHNAP